jgi:hypothetical protein
MGAKLNFKTYLQNRFLIFFNHLSEHRVGRMLSVSPVVGIGTPPPLKQQASVPPTLYYRGRAHSLAAKGVGESQFQRGDIHCGALYI